MRSPFVRAILLLLVFLPARAEAQSRLLRRLGEDAGVVPPVWGIVQDSDGFLWVGTEGGLLVHDGGAPHVPPGGAVPGAVVSLAAGPDGRVAAVTDRGEVYEVRGGTPARLDVPGTAGPRSLRMVAYDGDGALWTIRGGSLVRRNREWSTFPPELLDGEQPHLIRTDAGGDLLVATDRGVWRATRHGRVRKLSGIGRAADLLGLPERLLILHNGVTEVDAAGARTVWTPQEGLTGARPVSLERRGATLWVSFDRFLVAVRPGGRSEVLAGPDGIDAGGPLFVDREGSLWMGTFSSLLQLPEPETRLWTERQGLQSRHVRFLARTGSTIWITSWQGPARIDTEPDRLRAEPVTDWFSQEPLCVGRDGGVAWTSSREGIVEIDAGVVTRLHSVPDRVHGCAPARAGGVWVAGSAGILRIAGPGARPVRVPGPAGEAAAWEAILEDRDGRLRVARNGRVCAREPATSAWRCSRLDATGKVTGLIELPSGAIWMSTMQAGVLAESGDGRWAPIPASLALPTAAIFRLRHARSGGVWVLGHGIVRRVNETAGDWVEVERLSAWNGLPITGGEDLLEDPDGTVWITTSLGAVEVPAAARFATADPPPVAIAEVIVDGTAVPSASSIDVPFRRNRLELRFAAPTFRDPQLARYQLRMSDDAPWQDARGSSYFRWIDLRPGRYTAEFRASLDGIRWSEIPARVTFRVAAPWYLQPWAFALFALLLAATGFGIHHARLRVLLGLERQRTRIALDLHDEIGSGLGSIGMLAGVLSAGNDDGGRDRELAGTIARTSEQLGESLSDIVWALDPGSATLHDLGTRLAEHGNRLFSADDGPDFSAELPPNAPATPLSLGLRRNVLAIGLEALHNAARHAGAQRVVLRLERQRDAWRLIIEDDGRGIRAAGNGAAAPLGGRGLPGMRRRANEIGARLDVRAAAGEGTRIELDFTLAS